MDKLVDLLLIALAAGTLVEVVRHDPRLAERRIQWETRGHWAGKLMTCGFCLSFWAAAAVMVLLPVHPLILWLAAVRLSNLISDTFHSFSRSPRRPESEPVSSRPKEIPNG